MKDELARRLLAKETGITDLTTMSELTGELQALAALKYDLYEGYRPGVKFMESLAIWLGCFEKADRSTALEFVRRRLVYLSRAEIDHLVDVIYPDVLRPKFLRDQSVALFGDPWRIAQTAASAEFRARERRMLVLGMSDGARLDKFRRSSPLSTEQFHQAHQIDPERGAQMQGKLEAALRAQSWTGPTTFQTVLAVDDFSASGRTMLREDVSGVWDGKLIGIDSRLSVLKEVGIVEADAEVSVLIYLITDSARDYLQKMLTDSGLAGRGFSLITGHVLAAGFPLQSPQDDDFLALCRKYYDSRWEDDNTKKGGKTIEFGFAGSATPLVLHHNAPNNTPPIVWKDEGTDPEFSPPVWFGVFPRHERHHASRP